MAMTAAMHRLGDLPDDQLVALGRNKAIQAMDRDMIGRLAQSDMLYAQAHQSKCSSVTLNVCVLCV